jgi:hypothetical protein
MQFTEDERDLMRQEGKTDAQIDTLERKFTAAEQKPSVDLSEMSEDSRKHFIDKFDNAADVFPPS